MSPIAGYPDYVRVAQQASDPIYNVNLQTVNNGNSFVAQGQWVGIWAVTVFRWTFTAGNANVTIRWFADAAKTQLIRNKVVQAGANNVATFAAANVGSYVDYKVDALAGNCTYSLIAIPSNTVAPGWYPTNGNFLDGQSVSVAALVSFGGPLIQAMYEGPVTLEVDSNQTSFVAYVQGNYGGALFNPKFILGTNATGNTIRGLVAAQPLNVVIVNTASVTAIMNYSLVAGGG